MLEHLSSACSSRRWGNGQIFQHNGFRAVNDGIEHECCLSVWEKMYYIIYINISDCIWLFFFWWLQSKIG